MCTHIDILNMFHELGQTPYETCVISEEKYRFLSDILEFLKFYLSHDSNSRHFLIYQCLVYSLIDFEYL